MIKFLNVEQVIKIHDAFLNEGIGLAGIRDRGLLESAVETPKATMFGEYLHKTLYDKAAAYVFHIVKNHAFVDGNKRTGSLSASIFLRANGAQLNYDHDEYIELVMGVESGMHDKKTIASFFRKNCS